MTGCSVRSSTPDTWAYRAHQTGRELAINDGCARASQSIMLTATSELGQFSTVMLPNRFSLHARWVLCAAILFVADNTVHAVEHDFGAEFSQIHTECSHCSVEQAAAISVSAEAITASAAIDDMQPAVRATVSVPTSTFQARAPPLS